MFEKFGEFDSAEELNAAAKGLLEEGDIQSLMELAKENGLEKEDAEDYIDGIVPELTTALMAACGRLKVEEKEAMNKNGSEKMALNVIRTMVQVMCTDDTIAIAVMKKGKRISDILETMKEAAKKSRSGEVGICCGTDRDLQRIIKAYYLESKKNFERKIEDLYKG